MKILIADDHALFRDGLSMRLEQIAPDATILQSATYSQTLKILEENKIDLIILDLDMPDMDWEDGYEALKEKSNGADFVIISASEDIRNIRRSLEMGARGYIPKSIDTKILSGALKLILDGGTYLPPSLINNPEQASKRRLKEDIVRISGKTSNKLTRRQEQVLSLVAEGKSNKQIAYELGVSEATVKLHVNALLKALDATNRTQALIIAQQKGLI